MDDTTKRALSGPLTEFAFVVPLEKFVYKKRGRWAFEEPVSEKGIKHHLRALGVPQDQTDKAIRNQDYSIVYGADLQPNRLPIFADTDGKLYINTWVPPMLQPIQGEYPRIKRVLEWVTNGDPGGIAWLKQWMAWKVQTPTLVPKVAVVLGTQQGGGKGTLAFVMRAMLGFENTAIVKREELGNKFNARWIGKLFVLGDEVLSSDSLKDISNQLKVLIDGNEIELEGKHANQRAITNKLAWMFASNDRIAPVVLERGDRRYSVFVNHEPLPTEYVQLLNSAFEPDRVTPTPEFSAEMSAFYYELVHTKVDRVSASRPYGNTARDNLIEANLTAHEMFLQHIDEHGIDDLIEDFKESNYLTVAKQEQWDLGKDGIAIQAVFRMYQDYSKRLGAKSLKMNRFCSAVKNHSPEWPSDRKTIAGRKTGVYVLPRKSKQQAPTP